MSGFQTSLVTFVTGTIISATDVNANFTNLNGSNVFSSGGVIVQNGDSYKGYDSSNVAHSLLSCYTDNDAHAFTTSANDFFKISSYRIYDIAVFSGKTGGGACIGVRNNGATQVFEISQNGDCIIFGQYKTHGTNTSIATGIAFDSYDVAEVYPHDRFYESGTVVCPTAYGQLSCCTHDGCHAAMLVSLSPGMSLGGAQVDYEMGILPIALAGRVAAVCSDPFVQPRQLVTSDGLGGVRAMHPGEEGFALGFTLNQAKDGRVGLFVRAMYCRNKEQ